ncbi:MAG: aminoacyl-histidine dipeptidase [Rikenellaceae bacterium]|nr:aminoacyl-histidine dipeptidase [Rikenellaceae bacterium]MCL2691874.1 aminoacyl-histidine dipeptidase [Rikenellaceae bacterium]
MSELSKLAPAGVWTIFEEITRIPRPSKKEEKIIAYLIDFAVRYGLDYRQDAIGNLVITRAAAPSMAGKPAVVLQSHVDMVCEKNSDVGFDFDCDPIQVYVDGEWVRARGTTLGADDGIGMAAALALLVDSTLEAPAIEALFTVDEETGLTGAFNLGENMLTGKYLINLDSEDDGEIFIGCAGGIDTVATFPAPMTATPSGLSFFRLAITGLSGGHSGDDINKGLANSNKLMTRFLWHGLRRFGLKISTLDGGNLRNAIPREAVATFAVPTGEVAGLREYYERYAAEVRAEFSATEPRLATSLTEVAVAQKVMEDSAARGLVDALQGVPNGVLAMSTSMPGLVETSTNLASVKPGEEGGIVVVTSQRSSIDSARFDAAASVESVFELGGATVTHSEGYPGWKPDLTSHLLRVGVEQYRRLFDVEPKVRAIHAGLECGLFLKKYPHLEMISIGPTVRGVHSPDERLEIATVDRFWKHLVAILQNI